MIRLYSYSDDRLDMHLIFLIEITKIKLKTYPTEYIRLNLHTQTTPEDFYSGNQTHIVVHFDIR